MSEFERKVSLNLLCPVCFELLSDPKQLICTHTFCKKCLNGILKSSSKDYVVCPICRSKTYVEAGNVSNLNTNVPLKSLIDDVKNIPQVCEMCDSYSRAVHFCCECGNNMCSTCHEMHNKWPPYDIHRVVRVEDVRQGRVVLEREVYCQEHKADTHKNICTDVCINCKKFICLKCRISYHDKKGHTVQSAKEYNASTKTQIESLLAQSKTKVTDIRNNVTCIKTQKKRVTDYIAGKKAEKNKSYLESLNILSEGKAASDKQLDAQQEKLCKRFDELQDFNEKLIMSIESASVLAGKSMRVPLKGDTIFIRNTLSEELKGVLDRDDQVKKLATADSAEQEIFTPKRDQLNYDQLQKAAFGIGAVVFLVCLIVETCIFFTPNNQYDQVRFVKCMSVCDVELSKKDCMNGIAATTDGRMAVGSRSGGIDIFSADGQLQKTVLKNVGIRDVGYLSDGRYVVINNADRLTLYTQECEKLDVRFDTLSIDEGGTGSLTVDSNDLIFVGYCKAKKIQMFSPSGGNAIREIPCDGYEPQQTINYNNFLIIIYEHTVRIIDKYGSVKYKEGKSGLRAYGAATQNNSILIAWVKHDDGLVSIDEYTSELKHVQTLISDHKIEKPEKYWYYLCEFRSGEIAFCTPDRLYIFKLTTTP